jgi:hypothetical protein
VITIVNKFWSNIIVVYYSIPSIICSMAASLVIEVAPRLFNRAWQLRTVLLLLNVAFTVSLSVYESLSR